MNNCVHKYAPLHLSNGGECKKCGIYLTAGHANKLEKENERLLELLGCALAHVPESYSQPILDKLKEQSENE